METNENNKEKGKRKKKKKKETERGTGVGDINLRDILLRYRSPTLHCHSILRHNCFYDSQGLSPR
jgi:hypothetical protein